MDLFAELESMAVNAVDDDSAKFEPSEDEIQRWQILFAYSYSEAIEQIKDQKGDYSRRRVSDEHWDLVRSEKEAQGFSRDSYEHWMKMGGQSTYSHGERKRVDTPASQTNSSPYLILLEGRLSTPKSIQDAANLSEPPHTVQAASETRDAMFCEIDGTIKQSIENWLCRQKSTFRPTFIRVSKAKKDLDSNSIYPTLGLESTLPQHRCSSDLSFNASLSQSRIPSNGRGRPVLQDEYPAWYFFYGTLADPDVLTRLLSSSEAGPSTLVPASISGGLIKSWAGKYKALVDGASTDYVHGSACEITSREQEDALLTYETENYEVVRCCITMASETVQGVTFRFVGPS